MATLETLMNGDGMSPGDQLTYDQVMALQANMFAKLSILVNGKVVPLDPKTNVKALSFTKAAIDDLFAANPGCDGLRLYLGVMDLKIVPDADPVMDNKIMVSLVTTTGINPNLDRSLTRADLGTVRPATAMDYSVPCPPYTVC